MDNEPKITPTKRITIRDDARRNWLRNADEGLNQTPQSYRISAVSQWVRVIGVPRSPSHFVLFSGFLLGLSQSILIGLKATETHWLPVREQLGLVLTLAILIGAGGSWWLSRQDKSLQPALLFVWCVFSAGIGLGGLLVL